MDKIKEELDIYKTVASMTGDIVYRYDIAEDSMELIFGRADMSKYGSTINNYVQMLYRQRSTGLGQGISVDDLIQGLKSPERGYFECKACISNSMGTVKWYNIIGRTTYDDYNEPKYIVGKMTEFDEIRSLRYENGDTGSYDRLTGFFDERGIKKKLIEKCNELSGEEAAFIKLKVEELQADEDKEGSDNIVVSAAQCIKRAFQYDAYMGRSEQNEFYIIYCGKDNNDNLIARLDDLKNAIISSVKQAGIDVIVNCGVYEGNFNSGQGHNIREKAHLAFIKAKYNYPGSIVKYSGELEKEFNTSHRNLENVEFDHKLVESALDIMSGSGDIDEAISLIFSEICKKYDLDRIVVHELDSRTETVRTTYNWISKARPYLESIILKERPIDRDVLEHICDKNDIIIAPDVLTMEQDEYYEKIQATGIKAFVHCVFTGYHHIIGCIGFECYTGRREWRATEIKTFKLISKILSTFLINMREYEELLFINESYETHDALTGLYKREAFKKEADKYIRYAKGEELAVIYTGMKEFILINSRFGYDIGDKVLKGYANAIADDERFVMGCRVNADNIVALVKVFDARGNRISSSEINRINNAFLEEYEHICPGMDINIVAGISIINEKNQSLDYYIDRAFEARGRAINSGLDGIIAD